MSLPRLQLVLGFLAGAGESTNWTNLVSMLGWLVPGPAPATWPGAPSAARIQMRRLGVVLTWLFLPLLLVVALSTVKPLLVQRYLIGSLPAGAIAAAVAIRSTRGRHGRRLQRWWPSWPSPSPNIALVYTHEDYAWRPATQYVFANAQAGDAVVVLPGWERVSYDHYLGQVTQGAATPMTIWPHQSVVTGARRPPSLQRRTILESGWFCHGHEP